MQRHGKPSLPLCDTTEGKECELIKSWQDGEGKVHNTPFVLHKSNFIPYELYERIVELGEMHEYKWERNKKQYSGNFPTLGMLEFVLSNFLPEKTTQDGLETIIEKITIIHNIRLRNFIGG